MSSSRSHPHWVSSCTKNLLLAENISLSLLSSRLHFILSRTTIHTFISSLPQKKPKQLTTRIHILSVFTAKKVGEMNNEKSISSIYTHHFTYPWPKAQSFSSQLVNYTVFFLLRSLPASFILLTYVLYLQLKVRIFFAFVSVEAKPLLLNLVVGFLIWLTWLTSIS